MLPMSSLGIIWAIVFAFGGWQAGATGSISGALKDATGAPLVGVRVGAVAVSGERATPTDSGVIVSLTQTNASGRYVLENVPAGRYFIAAGLVAFPTYYPGTAEISRAAVVTVGAGAALSSYDFTAAITTAPSPRSTVQVQVPVRIVTEDGQPFSGGVRIIARPANPLLLLWGGTIPNLSLPAGDYLFHVEGLAFGYALKSVSYRGADRGLGPVTIDPNAPGDLVLTIGDVPPSQIRGATVRGRFVNVAPEWLGKRRTVRLQGFGQTVVETTLAQDGTFDFGKVPLNDYEVLLTDVPGVWARVVVRREGDVRELEVGLGNNPFPEFSAGPITQFFDSGQPLTLQGTVTQSVVQIRSSTPVHYFRIEVKDETSGKTVPWAVMLQSQTSPQNLTRLLQLEVGTPVVVAGPGSKDGTTRIHADPANGVNGMAIPTASTP
jgi:Carboxypeptidase regulatory-like domain